MVYENTDRGVFIQDIDGNLYKTSAWDSSKTPNGIAVKTDACSFIIALQIGMIYKWGGSAINVTDITTATSESEAIVDYDGSDQTAKIINQLGADTAQAANYCNSYTFPNGQKGYLGAAGEWKAALDNKSLIDSALAACGGEAMNTSGFNTSTQYNEYQRWYFNWVQGTFGHGNKDDKLMTRPLGTI